MRSLRLRLLLGTALATTAVLVVSGVVLYALVSRALRAEFDQSLAAKARSFTALMEQDGGRLECDLAEVALPEFEPSDQAEYYQVWLPDGAVFTRSPSLRDANLDRLVGASDAPVFRTARLPDGQPGRLVGLTFTPKQERPRDQWSTPGRVTLVLGRNLVGLRVTLARLRGVLFGVGLFAVVVSSGVLAGVVARTLRPVGRLSVQIAGMGEADLSTRIDSAGMPSELLPVVDRLNALLARLDAAFQRERRFTGDVAHELRTPLAGLRAKLELALSRERGAEAYRQALDTCLEISQQMQVMVENLLHMARADAGQLEVCREPVDLVELIEQCWRSLADQSSARGLTIEWRLPDHDVVETDREKLRLVVQNVLANAVAYADENSCIRAALTVQDGMRALTVGNAAGRMRTEHVERVFDRFWRADSSCQSARTRCGLGLPLSKAMIERLGGTIAADVSAGSTFTVTLRLPCAGASPRTGLAGC